MLLLEEYLSELEQNCRDAIERAKKTAKEKAAKAKETYAVLEKMKEEGFPVHRADINYPHFHIVEKKYWQIVHKIFGKLIRINIYPVYQDVKRREIGVVMTPKNKKYEQFTFSFQTTLNDKSKCKIVKEESSRVTVVCEL